MKSAQESIRSALSRCGDVTTASWWNSFARKRQDVWGIADLEFIHPSIRGVVFVQCTTILGISSHKSKIADSEFSGKLLKSGNRIWLIGYGSGRFAYWSVESVPHGPQWGFWNGIGFTKHQSLGSLIRQARQAVE
jgi:hypothetical protein